MYELVAAVLALAIIQYTFAWRFHGIYTGLHDKFSKTVEDAEARKSKEFGESLFSLLQVFAKEMRSRHASPRNLSRDQMASILCTKSYVDEITKLAEITERRERVGTIYKAARENAKSAYTFLMISGSAALLGLLPALGLGDTFWYYVFGLPLMLVVTTWIDYNRYETELVKLRDEPVVGA
jgi:hypothetical protein